MDRCAVQGKTASYCALLISLASKEDCIHYPIGSILPLAGFKSLGESKANVVRPVDLPERITENDCRAQIFLFYRTYMSIYISLFLLPSLSVT